MTRTPLILDACVVLNLAASQRLDEILVAGDWLPIVTTQAATEAMWFEDDSGVRQHVDYNHLGYSSELEIWSPVDDELLTLVTLAAELGDGEAASLAVGHGRNVHVATDDRSGRRAARALTPPVRLMSTSELLRNWAASRDVDTVAEALLRIEGGASFRPPRNDPNAPWWSEARRALQP